MQRYFLNFLTEACTREDRELVASDQAKPIMANGMFF
jgi:hypothetical protein